MNRRKRLGQHYLVDEGVIDEVVIQAEAGRGKRILEIGAGRGALTQRLAGLAGSLRAVEIDRDNLERTRKVIGKATSVELKLGNAFDEESEFDFVVSSLPYSESSTFVEWLCAKKYSKAIVILQRDFVDKLMASPGRRNYRAISAIAQRSFTLKVIRTVGRDAFEPPPRVESRLVVITPLSALSHELMLAIKRLFSLRNRAVRTALRILGLPPDSVSAQASQKRVRELDPNEVHEIAKRMSIQVS